MCIGPYTYTKVYDPEHKRSIILAKDCLERFPNADRLQVVCDIQPKDLVGLAYQPLFNYYADDCDANCFHILQDDYVTTSDGTGIVHMAPAHGEDDYRVCQAHGITPVCPLDLNGCFMDVASDFVGMYLKDADKKIIRHLKDTHHLYHQDVIVHNYPFCPRSDTPLIYRTMPSWFVRLDTIKETLLTHNETISWHLNILNMDALVSGLQMRKTGLYRVIGIGARLFQFGSTIKPVNHCV